MKKELFLQATASKRWTTVDEVVKALDGTDYWDGEFFDSAVTQQKKAHVRRQMKQIKDENGFPLFASIVSQDENGDEKHIYKQETLFDIEDYRQTINYHVAVGQHHVRRAIQYSKHALKRFGVQIPLPFGFTEETQAAA